MNNKFKMELVWHNCETYPPKELENSSLIVTNGKTVFGMSWHRAEGYWILINDECMQIRNSELKNWWWADVQQTVQNDNRFTSKD